MFKRIAGVIALVVVASQAITGAAAAASGGLGVPWAGTVGASACDLSQGRVDGAWVHLWVSRSTLLCDVTGDGNPDDSEPLVSVGEPLVVRASSLQLYLADAATGSPADYRDLTMWVSTRFRINFLWNVWMMPEGNPKDLGADLTITDTTFTGHGLDGVIRYAETFDFSGAMNAPNADRLDARGVTVPTIDYISTFTGDDVVLLGDADVWVVFAGEGDDRIEAGAGDVIGGIHGEDGDDVILTGGGDDIVFAGGGVDTVDGGDGDDLLDGEGGADVIHGGAGDDDIHGGAGVGADRLYGDAGDDALIGELGSDRLYGGEGDDELDCRTGSDDDEADQCWGQGDDDSIDVGSDGSGASDAATDVAAPGDGENEVDIAVADGSVALSYADRTSGVDLLIGPMTGPSDEVCDASDFGDDTVTGACDVIVSITGSNFADVIDAGDADNGTGLVAISGLKGADRLVGGENAETIVGGPGADRIAGNDGGDELSGGKGEDHILGGEGGDTIYAGSEDDKVFAGAGSDDVYGSTGDDLIYGEDDSDDLVGGVGDDRLSGGEGDDDLVGAAGDDQLHGDAGDDDLVGNLGDDRAWGDEGSEDYCNAEVTGTCEWVRVVTATGGYWAKV